MIRYFRLCPIAENEYLMRTVLRVCVVCKEGVAPFAADIIKQLTEVLARVGGLVCAYRVARESGIVSCRRRHVTDV